MSTKAYSEDTKGYSEDTAWFTKETLFRKNRRGEAVVVNEKGMGRKRKLCVVFKTFVWAMVSGQPHVVFSNMYARGKSGAEAAKFLRRGAGEYLNAKLGADPLGVWEYEDDGSVWFEDEYAGTQFWVVLRGTTRRGLGVEEVGLTLIF